MVNFCLKHHNGQTCTTFFLCFFSPPFVMQLQLTFPVTTLSVVVFSKTDGRSEVATQSCAALLCILIER